MTEKKPLPKKVAKPKPAVTPPHQRRSVKTSSGLTMEVK